MGPDEAAIHIQCGHMFKEAGDLKEAETHYLRARQLTPDDADLALQLGHFYKVSGRLEEAAASYRRASVLSPGWSEPVHEISRLRACGWMPPGEPVEPKLDLPERDVPELEFEPLRPPEVDLAEGTPRLQLARAYADLAPELAPRSPRDLLTTSYDSINVRQFGVRQNTFWGERPVLRGVEAIRGFCISTIPLLEVVATVNGLPVHRGPVKGPYELQYERDKSRIHKYVFNIWCDLSRFAPGQYELELRFTDAARNTRSQREWFVIEPPLLESHHPDSDGVINLDPSAGGSIDEQISARPSALHPGKRPDRRHEVRNILIARADQLGDLVASIPGIIRLREHFPDARIVGLFGPGNIDLARTLPALDEVIELDHRESLFLRTRVLTLKEQVELRRRLAPYNFDVAIDLSQSLMSRPLLALSGARFTYGFKDPGWPRLTASVDDAYYDPKNRREIAAHATRIVTMIDRLAALMHSQAQVIRRDDLSRDRLGAFGIRDGERYAVLHTGARIKCSRWPGYLDLASLLLEHTDLKIVMFADEPDFAARIPPEMARSERVQLVDRKLPFDDFDALLSFCAVFVGNDSGPKHLASLRGVNVVSIHSARINWSEWGQEMAGTVISRKVPCAGCHIYHDEDECGRDWACVTDVKLKEVFDVVMTYL